MNADLVKIATEAAVRALEGADPAQPDFHARLAAAIGQAVAAGIERHEMVAARHTALAMAGLSDDEGTISDWQV